MVRWDGRWESSCFLFIYMGMEDEDVLYGLRWLVGLCVCVEGWIGVWVYPLGEGCIAVVMQIVAAVRFLKQKCRGVVCLLDSRMEGGRIHRGIRW